MLSKKNLTVDSKKALFLKNREFFKNVGIVDSIADGIVSIVGLTSVANGEMINFCIGSSTIAGLILNLERKKVSAVVLGIDKNIKPGQYVIRRNELMSVPTGQGLLGRVVDL